MSSVDPRERAALLRQVDMAIRARDLGTAVALAERGLELGIEHPGLLNLVAHGRIERERFDEAVQLLERARALAPSDVHVLNSLGIALKRMGRWAEAANVFDAAIAADPRYANAHFNKGGVLESMQANDGAEAAYRQAVVLEANFADASGRLSYLAAVRGDYNEALALAKHAAGNSGAAAPEIRLAQFAHLRGDHDAAKALAAQALARDATDASPILILAAAEIATGEGDAAMLRLQKLLDAPATDLDTHSLATGLVGRIEEQRGNFARAFEAFAASKAEQARVHAGTFMTPDGSQYAARVARMLCHFREAPPAEMATAQAPTEAQPGLPATHVFLLGFPRSGTTLLEKSLAAHPVVATMEEEESLDFALAGFFIPDDGWRRFDALSPSECARYRDAYWRTCRATAGDLTGKVFIDKMPLNTILLPVIAKLFPQAKILFALRDPRDVVLSCLKQQFAMTAAMYEFTTLEGAARLYDIVMRFAELCRANSGLEIMDTRYEDLVADFDGAMRRICDFLGLAWDASLRTARENARDRLIRTPSAPQVTRGLYDGSGQWRRYREQMAPVLPVLAPWVSRFGYAE